MQKRRETSFIGGTMIAESSTKTLSICSRCPFHGSLQVFQQDNDWSFIRKRFPPTPSFSFHLWRRSGALRRPLQKTIASLCSSCLKKNPNHHGNHVPLPKNSETCSSITFEMSSLRGSKLSVSLCSAGNKILACAIWKAFQYLSDSKFKKDSNFSGIWSRIQISYQQRLWKESYQSLSVPYSSIITTSTTLLITKCVYFEGGGLKKWVQNWGLHNFTQTSHVKSHQTAGPHPVDVHELRSSSSFLKLSEFLR